MSKIEAHRLAILEINNNNRFVLLASFRHVEPNKFKDSA